MRRATLYTLFITLLFASAMGNAQVTYPPIFGIQDDKMIWDPTLRPKAQEVGARWVRQYVFWDDIEPDAPSPDGTPGYDWSFYDSLFLEYKNLGLTVIALVSGIPPWAAPNSYGPFYPGRMNDFTRFIRDLVERYDGDGMNDAPGRPVVNFFEFFNEPDLNRANDAGVGAGYWSGSGSGVGGSGAGYAQMLTAVYPEVKASNPNAMVVLGGLAFEYLVADFNFYFLSEVLSSGGGNYFDIMNFHYYRAFESFWSYWGKDILGKVNYVRTLLDSQQKPIFVTESGDWSSELDQCMIFYRRSEETQAEYVPKLFVRALSDTDIKTVEWFILQDSDYGPAYVCDSTRGLFRADGSRKPSYYAYRTASSLLSGASFQGMLANTQNYEGYQFLGMGGRSIYALWNESGNLSVSLNIPSSQVGKVDKLGNQQVIYPAYGNQYNLTIGPDPIYLINPPSVYVEQNGSCGGNTLCKTSVQEGIYSAQPFANVEISQETYAENIILDEPKKLTIRGGWDVSFTTIQSSTVINSLTISNGTLVILGGVVLQ